VAQLSSAELNNLPDSAFAYIEPGGTKDGEGKTAPRSLRHFAIHDEAHVRNALSRAPQSPFGKKAMPKILAAAKRFKIQVQADDAQRSDELQAWPEFITRSYSLADVELQSGKVTCERCGKDATGHMVDAYVVVFGQQAEIHDELGHYREDIHRNAFNLAISRWQGSPPPGPVSVFYNHGMTLYGTPSEMGSQTLGHPAAIRADSKGVLTSTHYGRTPFAEGVKQDLVDGNLGGHSFTGRIVRSDPPKVPRIRRGDELPRVTRLEMGLKEYGPTPMPAYANTGVVASRADLQVDEGDQPARRALTQADIARRARMAQMTRWDLAHRDE